MSTLLFRRTETVHTSNIAAADRLRTQWPPSGMLTWFGTRKSLSIEQKAQAAESFGAQGQFFRRARSCSILRIQPSRRSRRFGAAF